MAEPIYKCCIDCGLLDVCDPNYNGTPNCVEKESIKVQQLKKGITIIANELERGLQDKVSLDQVWLYNSLRNLVEL